MIKIPFKSEVQKKFMFSQKPKLAKEFSKHANKAKELAESSAASDSLFKEDIPRKIVIAEVWQNENKLPPQYGTRLESAADADTLMGRLAKRMASRDMIDELNLGPKGMKGKIKEAQIADESNFYKDTKKIHGLKENGDSKTNALVERTIKEHGSKKEKKMLGMADMDVPRKIRIDDYNFELADMSKATKKNKYKEDPSKKKVIMPNVLGTDPKLLNVSDQSYLNEIPSKMMIGGGLHEQTHDLIATNNSDPIQNIMQNPGSTMRQQALNLAKNEAKFKGGDIPDHNFNQEQLNKGTKVENEQTNDYKLAKQIAKGHLIEDPNYYVKLRKVKL